MCICINCLFIKDCKAYEFIEKMHKLKINEQDLFFNPKQTIIKNEILTVSENITIQDWDVKECTNFLEKGGSWFNKK